MALPAFQPALSARVLVVDDSAFMRHAIERLLAKVPGIEVVGAAADGVEAVQKVLELRPDVITMDVEMPRMDGVTAVGEIMKTVPTPIVMVSTMTTAGAETTMRALEAGAVDFIAKPSHLSAQITNVADELTAAIHRARNARVSRRRPQPQAAFVKTGSATSAISSAAIAVIGCSTGGPPALTEVVPHLPADMPAGVVVVQHMPAGFTGALARRLDQLSPLHVKEAAEGDVVAAGQVLIAPGDYHTVIGRDRRIRLNQAPQVHGVRPSVDVTLESVAEVYGSRATVAILTGMGRDGADGCVRVEGAGGRIIVQDEATSVVYGMPRVAREKTRHALQLPIGSIAGAVAEGARAAAGRGR